MVKMKIAFLMDGLGSIDPATDTTCHLMYECNRRGHALYYLEPHDIYIRKNEVVARMHNITLRRDLSFGTYRLALTRSLKRDGRSYEKVADLDALFLSSSIPLNTQAMEFLLLLKGHVFMINSPSGQVLASSKLYILNFPEIIPETHISRDPFRLKKIIDDFGGSMVVKPLQRYLGEGVIKVSTRDQENLSPLIHYYVKAFESYPEREPIMVQEYLHAVEQEGDVRILLLGGETLGAVRRRPYDGDFRTHLRTGARVFPHKITPKEREICLTIKDRLLEDGLFLVGIDIIGDRLVEISGVSPGGLPVINRLYNERLEAKVADFIERKVLEMTQL